MKVGRIAVAAVLVGSLVLNVLLWREALRARAETEASWAAADGLDALRTEIESLRNTRAVSPQGSNDLEMARLRSEIGPLRRQAAELPALRAQVSEAAGLRQKLHTATQELAAAERGIAEVTKMTPEQMEQMLAAKTEAQATGCMNNIKQIGLAAILYASENGGVFPRDFMVMTNELGTPKILICPAGPSGLRPRTWAELNPATISYRFVNPGGTPNEPTKPLTICPFHESYGLSDGSVQRGKK